MIPLRSYIVPGIVRGMDTIVANQSFPGSSRTSRNGVGGVLTLGQNQNASPLILEAGTPPPPGSRESSRIPPLYGGQ